MPRYTPSVLSVSLALALVAPHALKAAEEPAAWEKPSQDVDSSVADWAKERLAPASETAAAAFGIPDDSLPARIDTPAAGGDATGANSLRSSGAATLPDTNPLRAGAPPARSTIVPSPFAPSPTAPSPVETAAARNAFAAPTGSRQPVQLQAGTMPVTGSPSRVPSRAPTPTTASNPFGALPNETAAPQRIEVAAVPRQIQPEPRAQVESRAQAEPRAFAPDAEASAPVAPLPSVPGAAERSAEAPPERSVMASRNPANETRWDAEATPMTFDESPDRAPAAKNAFASEPEFDSFTSDNSFTSDKNAPINEGAGQPGPSELEGPQAASLVVEKRGPGEARVGQPCRFVVRVRNTGRQAASNVVLTDEAPAGARLIATVPPADQRGGRVSWSLGTLAPGEERAVEMRLEPLREGPIGSVATVSFDASASAATNCTRPALAMRATTGERVRVGDRQVIQIEMHNPGTGPATNVMLLDNVPDNLRHAAGPELEFEVGTLAPGETRRIDLVLTAESAGHVLNKMTAVADGDLRAEETVEFDVVAPSLALSVQGPKRRYLERPASYTVSIENPGTAPAKDVRVVTHLPRGMEFVSANNLGEYDAQTHAVYWSLAELPEGERGAVEVTALPIAAGEHTLRIEGETSDGLKAGGSRRVVVEGVASLAFELRDLQDPIELGGEAAYDILVTNDGTKAATNVRVRLEAPTGMRVVAAQGQSAHRLADQRAEFAPLDRLEPGAEARFRVRLRGEQSGDQRVMVLIESDDLSQPIRREESTRVFGND